MNETEIRARLSVHRAGEVGVDDARLREAQTRVESDHDLANWWAEEQALDELIAAKLESVPVPTASRAHMLPAPVRAHRRSGWARKLTLAAAAIVVLAALFSSWRGPFQPAVALGEFSDEMVSFVRGDPVVELESSDISQLLRFLENSDAPSALNLPPNLLRLSAVGCRVLRFRGENVSLLCFERQPEKLVHLFVVNRKVVDGLRANRKQPQFGRYREWATAAWTEGEHAYLLTLAGERAAIEDFLGRS